MKFVRNDCTDPYFNMSFDECCLTQAPSDDAFFCLWRNRPSVIIGLNQNAYSEVNLPFIESEGILLARRVTGGGAVYHDLQNLNYSIFRSLSESEGDNGADAVGIIVRALETLGVPAQQGGRNDIYVDGRKISGFARRIYKDRELVHGTLMFDVDIETLSRALDVPGSKLNRKGVASVRSRVANIKDYLGDIDTIDSFQAALQGILAGDSEEIRLPEETMSAIRFLAENKFSTSSWLYDHVKDTNSDAL